MTADIISRWSHQLGVFALYVYSIVIVLDFWMPALTNVLLLTLLGGLLIRGVSGQFTLLSGQLMTIAALVAIVVSLLLATLGGNVSGLILAIRRVGTYVILTTAAAVFIQHRQAAIGLLTCICIGFVATTILTVVGWGAGGLFGVELVSGPRQTAGLTAPVPRIGLAFGLSYGAFGILTAITFAIGLGLFDQSLASNARWPLAAGVGLCSVVLLQLILTQSRSTLLAVGLVAVVSVIAYTGHRSPDLLKKVLTAGIVATIPLMMFLGPSIYRNFINFGPGAVAARQEQFSGAINSVLESPIVGLEWTGYSDIHNFWLSMTAYFGVPIGILWVVVFALPFIGLLKSVRSPEADLPEMRLAVVGLAALSGAIVELSFYPGFQDTGALALATAVGIWGAVNRS